MASTRNISTRGNYAQYKQSNARAHEWAIYEHGAGGVAVDPAIPGNGFGPARIPASKLSSNPTQIESFLWGIGSTQYLETGDAPPVLVPEFTHLQSAQLFKTPDIIMPRPLVVPKNSRPSIP